jgi:predicted metal-dependent HD superfamily phosphohydrolase
MDHHAVYLSIYFHDIIYNPKSSTNEEDSANIFDQLFSSYLDRSLIDKVKLYILETKKHDVIDSNDKYLQFFIDFDMSVLGRSRAKYVEYATQIRQEYQHVEYEAYCKGRSKILRDFLQQTSSIYATTELRDLYEEVARANVSWECEVLEAGTIPILSINQQTY